MTVPNMLSIFRMIMIPVYALMYFSGLPDSHIWAGLLLILSTMTDAVDGWIARRFHQISELGKILDPLADKLTQFCVMVCLVTKYLDLIPLVVYIFFKEFLMLMMTIPFITMKISVYPAKWFGKVATFGLFVFSICFTMFPGTFEGLPMRIISAVLILLLAIALFGYGVTFIRMLYDRQLEREVPSAVPEGSLL